MPSTREKSGVLSLSKVKRTFLRMASPFEYGGDPLLFTSIHTVNIPPMIARADAAYERALGVFKQDPFSRDDASRIRVYQDAAALFRIAFENVRDSELRFKAARKKFDFDGILPYYEFLTRMSSLLLEITRGQTWASCGSELSSFLGKNLLKAEQTSDDLLSGTEIGLFHFLAEFLTENDPAVTKLRSKFKQLLPKADLERYTKSYSEHVGAYASMGVVPDVAAEVESAAKEHLHDS